VNTADTETLSDRILTGLKRHRILLAGVMLVLGACATNEPKKFTGGTTAPIDAHEQLAAASKLVADKNWPEAQAALRAIIEAPTFSSLTSRQQFQILWSASVVGITHGDLKLGYAYLVRDIAMPEAGFEQWRLLGFAGDKLGKNAVVVNALTVMAKRWPDKLSTFEDALVFQVIRKADQLPPVASLDLLGALYAAHWKTREGIEPSAAWRDLTLLLLADADLTGALDVSSHVTDPYVLVAMRSDRRFDAIIAAHSKQFDIDSAATREFHDLQIASEKSSRSLRLKVMVIQALGNQQHYPAMLAASDAELLELRSTNYPEKLYDDYFAQYNWLLNERATALRRLGRWDEAVEQLAAASKALENHAANVSQAINLSNLYCALGRPKEALAAIDYLGSVSAYGAMQLEAARLEAAVQLNDQKQVNHSLAFLRTHAEDAPITYLEELIVTNQLDDAADLMKAQLQDPRRRQEVLLRLQDFASYPEPEWTLKNQARWHEVVARKSVQAAINKVGRVESYHLEEP
jgi:beta-barrel assembly-enhancing protease